MDLTDFRVGSVALGLRTRRADGEVLARQHWSLRDRVLVQPRVLADFFGAIFELKDVAQKQVRGLVDARLNDAREITCLWHVLAEVCLDVRDDLAQGHGLLRVRDGQFNHLVVSQA